MGGQFAQAQEQALARGIDVSALAARLDRADILLLREFYATGRPYPDDTDSHVLRLLAGSVAQSNG